MFLLFNPCSAFILGNKNIYSKLSAFLNAEIYSSGWNLSAALTWDTTGSVTAAWQLYRKYRNIGIQQEHLHDDTLHAADARLLWARAAI